MESSLLGSCPHWRSHKNHTRSRSICRGNGSLQAVRGWLERNPFFPKDLPGNRETPHSQPSSLSARVKYTQARFCGQVGLVHDQFAGETAAIRGLLVGCRFPGKLIVNECDFCGFFNWGKIPEGYSPLLVLTFDIGAPFLQVLRTLQP